ncbi:RNA polymerase sigma factor [Nitriliruptor alkaliphilus]|uniref:RNA polymerase sigma factor n=1 Tax=Nitriliruptor alkaliphilus TaxID=427918 RepID=UPI000698B8DA|nr:hypothetical protein [Nitriliruptor alkaliphilus]
MTAWLPDAIELEAYEGMRHGDEHAFRTIAEPLQPALRRLAALYVDVDRADGVVLHSWEVALRGADMFRWHTPYATWIAGMVADHGRSLLTAPPALISSPAVADDTTGRPGPTDWSDLPWSARWTDALATLSDAVTELAVEQREVLHGRVIEGWPARRVCDVFGLPEVTYQRRLTDAHDRLHDALARLVGGPTPAAHRDGRHAAIARCLARPEARRGEQLDPRALVIFRRWAASGAGWRRFVRAGAR